MAAHPPNPDESIRPTPEEQTAQFREQVQDWPAFVEGIVHSREELAAWRAAGNQGWPPGWVTLRDHLREYPL